MPALCRTGAQGEYTPPSQCFHAHLYSRCTARPNDLDEFGEGPGRRSHEHTYLLQKHFDLKMLWDEYGIVGNIMVCPLPTIHVFLGLKCVHAWHSKPFTASFPRADIHELLTPDLLHQIIKGTFKDHLVSWVEEYLVLVHGKTGAADIMADIDRRYAGTMLPLCISTYQDSRIAAVPSFPALRRFHQGRGFKQWTGDDSKALMKVNMSYKQSYILTNIHIGVSARYCRPCT